MDYKRDATSFVIALDGLSRSLDANILKTRAGEKLWYHSDPDKHLLSEDAYLRLKRITDVVLGTLLLFLALPVLAACVLAIKLESPAAAYYVQERTGKGGRRFKMYKLRTMVKNAPALKIKYQHLNVLSYPDFKIPNDPRITKVGRVLRKTSLDELPQLINVISGEMSLVGPRPTSFDSSTYSLWHTERLEAKPGLTGLWQISGRCNLDFDQRARLDIAYLRNRSMWLDMLILYRTIFCVLTSDGAE
ncbi:MAG: sugar transferase [Gammaproteobacteria bacterium]